MKRKIALQTMLGFLMCAFSSFVGDSLRAQDFKAVLANPERPASERDLDAGRKPEQLLEFYGVKPGDKVADLMASRGYYTAILSQIVGEKGIVYSASPTVREETRARFKNPLYANVEILEGDMGTVALPTDGSLDFVLIHLDYHELDQPVRSAMSQKVFAALKPGGGYGVVDHSALDGAGDTARKTLHRIDKNLVIQEVTGAGFKLAKEGDMLRNPQDTRAEPIFKNRGKTDRFVLYFEKLK